MPFWISLFFFVVSNAILGILNRQDAPQDAKASGLGDFKFPTADASRVIPVICGTVLLRAPNVTWFGDLRAVPIVTSVPSGIGGFGRTDVVTGYQYFAGMQLALCQGPVDTFRAFWWDDRVITSTTSTIGDKLRVAVDNRQTVIGTLKLDNEDPHGDLDFYYGTSSQSPNDYMESVLGIDLPGYRTVAYAVLRQMYVGTSTFIKTIGFEVSKFPNTLGLTSGKHIIGTYDANPACFLYDLLINQDWGLGRPSGELDLASFQAAGNALYTEGLGISSRWETRTEAEAIIQDVLRLIDGVIYRDPQTGLVTLKLARFDYDPNTIPALDESMISDVEITRGSWPQLINTVTVNYTSRVDAYTERTAPAQNPAAIAIQGDRFPASVNYLGASRAEVAASLAARELKSRSYPIAHATVTVDRHAWKLTPGAVFKLNYAPDGIAGVVMRVTRPSYGELESPEITLECVEDIFAIATGAFSAPPASGWVNPISAPSAVSAQRLLEMPYHLIGSESRLLLAAAVRSAGTDLGYQIVSDRAGGTAYALTNTSPAFTPSGLLTAAYAVNTAATDTTGFTVDGGTDLASLLSCTEDQLLAGRNLAQIDSELISWRDVVDHGDGTFTLSHVMRGVLDTVPAAHADNARVWFLLPGGTASVDPNPYPGDGTVTAKLLPFNALSVLPVASATQLTIATASRAQLPYPPGNVKVNAAAYPATVTAGVDAPVTWAHRNRVTLYFDKRVVAQDQASYGAVEGNYTIEVRVGGTLKRTVLALTGTTWTWTAAMQASDAASAGASVSIRVIPVNGSLVGTYQERLFTMA